MPEKETPKDPPWTLNITARSEIEVPADVEAQLLDWHGGKRAATKYLRECAFVDLNWAAMKTQLGANIKARNETRKAVEADRDALRTLRTQRDWARAGFKTTGNSNPYAEEVAASVAGLTKESVADVMKQLTRLDEEDAGE